MSLDKKMCSKPHWWTTKRHDLYLACLKTETNSLSLVIDLLFIACSILNCLSFLRRVQLADSWYKVSMADLNFGPEGDYLAHSTEEYLSACSPCDKNAHNFCMDCFPYGYCCAHPCEFKLRGVRSEWWHFFYWNIHFIYGCQKQLPWSHQPIL
mgnify:FL=1